MTYEFSIGADPEIFVGVNGKFISAHGMVEGTKERPLKVDKGAVQVDGMALEFNIDPAKDFLTFQSNIESVYNSLKGMIGDKDFLQQCSVFFDAEDIKDVPKHNLMLGCMPDFNAYTMDENPMPNGASMMRTAGGHVHIGGFDADDPYDYDHFSLSSRITMAMDKYVGIYSLLWDKDDKRRKLYGQAGAFRPKEYGLEYRTLSNAWIFSKDLVKFIYDQTEKAVHNVLNNEDEMTTTYRDIINTSDRDNDIFKGNRTANLVRDIIHA